MRGLNYVGCELYGKRENVCVRVYTHTHTHTHIERRERGMQNNTKELSFDPGCQCTKSKILKNQIEKLKFNIQ